MCLFIYNNIIVDGYFLAQLSASYGNQDDAPGHKLSHMIDAIGAVASFHISNGQVSKKMYFQTADDYRLFFRLNTIHLDPIKYGNSMIEICQKLQFLGLDGQITI